MTLLMPEEEYPMEPFQWYLPAVHAAFEQFKVDIHFANFGKIETVPICYFLLLWTGYSYFFFIFIFFIYVLHNFTFTT